MADGEFLTEMQEGAAAAHELFLAYQSAGFTEAQAIQILTGVIAATAQNGS